MLETITAELDRRFTLRYVAENELADLEAEPPPLAVPRGNG